MRKLNDSVAPHGFVPDGAQPLLYIDTRQKYNKHANIDNWLIKHNIYFEYRKLDFGDYMRADGKSNISIDTKQNVAEVAGNLGRDNRRFKRECERAAEAGYRLVVLIEEGKFKAISDVKKWLSPACTTCPYRLHKQCNPYTARTCYSYKRHPMQGSQVAKTMATFEEKYKCSFMFCYKRDTARIICDLLGIEVDGDTRT